MSSAKLSKIIFFKLTIYEGHSINKENFGNRKHRSVAVVENIGDYLFDYYYDSSVQHFNHYTKVTGLMSWVFANGPGGRVSIPGRVIPNTQKMVLNAPLLSTQHYKVRIKGKVEQPGNRVAPSV